LGVRLRPLESRFLAGVGHGALPPRRVWWAPRRKRSGHHPTTLRTLGDGADACPVAAGGGGRRQSSTSGAASCSAALLRLALRCATAVGAALLRSTVLLCSAFTRRCSTALGASLLRRSAPLRLAALLRRDPFRTSLLSRRRAVTGHRGGRLRARCVNAKGKQSGSGPDRSGVERVGAQADEVKAQADERGGGPRWRVCGGCR